MSRINFYLLNYFRLGLLFVAVSMVIFLIFNQSENQNPFIATKPSISTADTSVANRYNRLAEKYLTTNLEHGHEMAAKAAFISKSIGYKQGEAKAYYILGEYNFLNNYDEKAIEYGEKAYKVYVKINDYKGAISSKEIIGKVFLKHEMFEQAKDVYVESLKTAKDLADNDLMAACYTDLGNVLKAKKDYNQAILYYKKANKIYVKINDNKGQATCYTDLGLTYKELRIYHASITSFEKALSLLRNEDNQKAFVYLELGIVESNNFNHEKAIDYFKKAEIIEAAHEDNFDLSVTLLKQSEVYMETNDIQNALATALRGSETAHLVGHKEVERDLYNIISEIYAHQTNYEKAYEFKSKAEVVDKDLTNDSQVKQISKLQASLEFNKKLEQERAMEQKLQDELNEQVSTHYLLIGMFIPLLITIIFFISRINISANYIRAIVFVTIILILEFLLVVLDPYIDKYTGGIPISKLLINTLLALLLAPFQHILERYIKKKVIESRMQEKKSTIVI